MKYRHMKYLERIAVFIIRTLEKGVNVLLRYLIKMERKS